MTWVRPHPAGGLSEKTGSEETIFSLSPHAGCGRTQVFTTE
jgi:hypothetical protein